MHDLVPIANYRTKLEAKMAAGLLDKAGIPCLIQSTEGILHGPLSPGATILVGKTVASHARVVFSGSFYLPTLTGARWLGGHHTHRRSLSVGRMGCAVLELDIGTEGGARTGESTWWTQGG